MADFCKACSIEHFGIDYKELAGLTTKDDWLAGRAVVVICEGCGAIQVDPQGNCVTFDCLCAGEEGHGGPWV